MYSSNNVPLQSSWLQKKIFAINIHCYVQAGYGDNVLMWGQLGVVYGSLSKTRLGRQWLQRAGLVKNVLKKWLVLKLEEILWKSDYEQM